MFRPLSVCVGLRFSRGRSTSGFVSFISASSVIGIAIGVIALIVGLSAMNGFEHELHHRVLSVIPEAEVRAESGEFVNPGPYMKRLLEGQGIRGASVFTEADAIAGNGLKFKAVRARGIDPATTGSTLGLREFMTPGSLESLTPGSRSAVLGKKVAEKLGVKTGDAITLLAVRKSGGADSSGVPATENLPFKVTGTFSIGGELDGALVFVNVEDAGELTGLPAGSVTGIEVRTSDFLNPDRIVYNRAMQLDRNVLISSWMSREGRLYRDINLVRAVMYIGLFMVIAVACFNIVSGLVMSINDKRSSIAILMSMGASGGLIRRIFMTQGIISGLIGTLSGTLLGVLAACNLTPIVKFLEHVTGRAALNGDIYFISFVPSEVRPADVALVAGAAILMSVISSWLPSLRVSHISPARELAGGV
ncbi:MAG: lipoprotein-releasing ABC transporter permease subunit [Succinivibrionaceae bacterium]|nr:lipoprotein-releasing ABC transporter permease subunit [Succinivibrionaceae bacterium]MDY6336540.1 lipoprotein-releasing ABC transporter permease subunit [Succinivibrionaceae bacterium]MDY6377047.1 lipoprotein-releasing ABC transporter permease subunit [Succinivibrionaceae bacterium]